MIWKQSVAAAGGECRHWLPTDSTRQTTTPVRAAWLDSIPLGREASLSHSPGRQASGRQKPCWQSCLFSGRCKQTLHSRWLLVCFSFAYLPGFFQLPQLSLMNWTTAKIGLQKTSEIENKMKNSTQEKCHSEFPHLLPCQSAWSGPLFVNGLPAGGAATAQSHSILSFKSSTCTFFLSVHMQVVKGTKELYFFACAVHISLLYLLFLALFLVSRPPPPLRSASLLNAALSVLSASNTPSQPIRRTQAQSYLHNMNGGAKKPRLFTPFSAILLTMLCFTPIHKNTHTHKNTHFLFLPYILTRQP